MTSVTHLFHSIQKSRIILYNDALDLELALKCKRCKAINPRNHVVNRIDLGPIHKTAGTLMAGVCFSGRISTAVEDGLEEGGKCMVRNNKYIT